MLLKAGVAMILVSLALAAVTVTAVGLRATSPAAPTVSVEPQAAQSTGAAETNPVEERDPAEKLEIADQEPGEAPRSEPHPQSPPERPASAASQPDTAQSAGPLEGPLPRGTQPKASRSESSRSQGPLPGKSQPEIPDWPQPTNDEVSSAEGPRYYDATSDTNMTLTIGALSLYDVPVISSYSYETLDRGLMHEPDTSFPWDGGAQRNVFIAGHYLGWPGTASHLVFYNLDKLKSGDQVVLKGRGRAYRYRVSESFMAGPDESWVMGQVRNRDMLTLQTCIPPTFEDRLIVRVDRA
jgi:sortase A